MKRWRLIAWLSACVMLCAAGATLHAALAADAGPATQGKAVFARRCAMCHREGQTGTFVLARRLGKEKSLLEQRTDLQPAYIRVVVRQGLVNMPRLSRVEMPDADLDAVIAYLSAPGSPPISAPAPPDPKPDR